MKKTIITLILIAYIFNLSAQNNITSRKWSIGISFTPNLSYLHNPTNYMDYLGEIVYFGYNYRSASAIKDHQKFDFINFGVRLSYTLNEKSDIETGIILSNKDYYSPQGLIGDEMPMIYFQPKLYFFDIPIIYSYCLLSKEYDIKFLGGIIASIPLFEYVNSNYELPLYNVTYTSMQSIVLTKNMDFYPLCINANISFRFTKNNNKKIKFEYGPVFQSGIMPFSKKLSGNEIDIYGNGNMITILNPEKGFTPFFIGFDLILSYNFYGKK